MERSLKEARTPDVYIPMFVPGKCITWKCFEMRFTDVSWNFSVRAAAHSE